MRLQALVLLSALAMLTGLAHAQGFITPPGYYTIVSNLPSPCTPVITTGGSIPSAEGGGALLSSPPVSTFVIAAVLLGLVLSVVLVGLLYMINRLFPHLGIEGWIGNEYWEIAKSALLVVIIFALLSFLSSVAVNLTKTPVTSYFGTNTYLNNINGLLYSSETYLLTVDSYAAAGWCTLGNVEFGTGLLNKLTVEYYVPMPIPIILAGLKFGVAFSPLSTPMLLAGTDPTVSQFQSVTFDAVTLLYYPLTMLVLVLIEILPILTFAGLAFFIPFGLVFRSLPFLRGIGGTFIAIGMGFALFIPMIIVLFNYPVTQAFQTVLPIQASAPNAVCNLGNGVLNFVCKAFGFVLGNDVRFLQSVVWGWSEFSGIYTVLNALTPYMVFMMLQEILLILDLVILYAVLDSIAAALGGSLNPLKEGLGGKFKLA